MSLLRATWKSLGLGGRQVKMSPSNVIFITGCDSGLGHALALFCHSLNMTVISACHNVQSEGARMLQNLHDPKRMITLELDLLKQDTILNAEEFVKNLLDSNVEYKFTALVNNAGIMCFGEFEWQTRTQIDQQIEINLLGTIRLTKQLLPLIRHSRARIINITSHCGLQALPGLGPYAASKAGLRFWNDSLRIDMQQYEVEVVNFIPGSFVMSSNICSRQQEQAKAQFEEFSPEQRSFYGDYFQKFHSYLQIISGHKAPNAMKDEELLEKFQDALANTQPKAMYIHEPWRYKMYRILFCICPTPIVDWLTLKFCAMPNYQEVNKSIKLNGKTN